MKRAFVIGAGVSGLTCGEVLSKEGYTVTVFEGTSRVGGMASTFEHQGHRFDLGPHKLFSPVKAPMDYVRGLFPDSGDLLSVPKTSELWFEGRAFNYPLSITELLGGISKPKAARFAASFVRARLDRRPIQSYADFMRRQFGTALYDAVFAPAARKVFGEAEHLSRRLGEARFRGKNLATFVSRAISPRRRIDAPEFLYPRRGTGEVPARLRSLIESRGGRTLTNRPVTAIHSHDRHVSGIQTEDEVVAVAPEDVVIYTAPLRDVPRMLGLESETAERAAAALPYRLLILVYVLLERPAVMKNQWVFFPQEDVCFNRLSEPINFSPDMVPDGQTSLIAEVTSDDADPGPAAREAERTVVADLVRLGFIQEAEVRSVHSESLVTGYPVWRVGFEQPREELLAELDTIRNIYPLGRQGLYQYVGILDCVDMAQRTAEFILTEAAHEGWTYIRREFEDYPVVD